MSTGSVQHRAMGHFTVRFTIGHTSLFFRETAILETVDNEAR